MRSDEKSAFLYSSARVPPYSHVDSLPFPLVTCLYRPIAPTRSARAAVCEATADGSTRPGFCGASSSVFTRSHPATATTAEAVAIRANRVRFIFFSIWDRPLLGSVLQVESERDV